MSQVVTGKKEPEQRASEREGRRGFLLHAQECEAVAFGKPRGGNLGYSYRGGLN